MCTILLTVFSVNAQPQVPFDSLQVRHDSRDDLYRTPLGAVPLETSVTLRFTAAVGDLDSVQVRLYDTYTQAQSLLPMQVVATTPDGIDIWELVVEGGRRPTVIYYRFLLLKGGETFFYEDDSQDSSGTFVEARKGGEGAVYHSSPDLSYQITVYDPDYYTPEWFRNAVVYQIFPDRFRDGDPSNNPENGQEIFYNELPLIFHETWNEPPVDGRTVRAPSGIGYFNSDFYGGDFAGITEKLDYLQSLGITAIYLNPIFEARSNHRYDTVDYLKVDPYLGTLEDFQTLVAEADAHGIKLILDGVFNHISSDSPIFDRYNRFPDVDGACESVESEYRDWFFFQPARGAQPTPCTGEDGDLYYVSWFGFDTIPKINSGLIPPRLFFFLGEDSVARTWGREGIGGWRLDVAGDIDNGQNPTELYWEGFRAVVRDTNPEAVIIGEEWGNATEWLLGDEWDSVMNYRFRRGIVGFVRGTDFADNDGLIRGLTPTTFEGVVRSVEEDYPPMAYHAMLNLIDSHDTTRAFFALNNETASLMLAALIQYTLPGAPSTYYGTEIAVDAPSISDGGSLQDDPYNRAPYPWTDTEGDYYPSPDQIMLNFYQQLGAMRHANPALREGEMITLMASDALGLYAFLRVDRVSGNAALVVLNMSDTDQPVTVNLTGLVPSGQSWIGIFGGELIQIEGEVVVNVSARSGEVWTLSTDASAFTAPAAPATVTAVGEMGSVSVSWDAVEDAAGYHVYRSFVPTGGYARITDMPVDAVTFTDSTVTNGFRYYYAVASVGEAGVIGVPSAGVAAVPSAPIEAVFYAGETVTATRTVGLEFGASVEVSAGIRIANVTDADGAAAGVLAQAALIPAAADPMNAEWQPMIYVSDQDGADVYSATLPLAQVGEFGTAARFSTDAGETWTLVTQEDGSIPTLVVEASDDTTPPVAPSSVAVLRASLSGVLLSWEAVADDTLLAYRVYRVDETGTATLLAEVNRDTLTYLDQAVVAGDQYSYGVSAVDGALNESEQVLTDTVIVEQLFIQVTFAVDVPDYTDGTLYLAGNFGSAGLPEWDPAGGGMQLTEVSENLWEITLELPEGSSFEYKFARGSWDAVEKGAQCEEIANRTLSVNFDSLGGFENEQGGYTIEHAVQKWRDLDGCG